MNKLKIGITSGDVNGIGLEVILKALNKQTITKQFTPVIYSSAKVLSYHKNIVQADEFQYINARNEYLEEGKINLVNCWQDNVGIQLGKATEEGGRYAFMALKKAMADLKAGIIDALVTAPVNKHALSLAKVPFVGHTQFLGSEFPESSPLMMMISDELKVALVTDHIPLANVTKTITKELLVKQILKLNESLIVDFGLEKPTIAVLGINPHAGDDGVIGNEDETIVKPAIIEVKNKGILAFGPFPADGFFGSRQYKKFDAVLAMYHDQGLAPFKLLSFSDGVNFTAGLPIVRTSPDHGTGYDIAGQNLADHTSMLKSIFWAVDILKHRREYLELKGNALVKHQLEREGDVDDELDED